MSTVFIPKSNTLAIFVNIAGAEELRRIIGKSARISGVGCSDYTGKRKALFYSRRIRRFLRKKRVKMGYYLWLMKYEFFFRKSKGFHQR